MTTRVLSNTPELSVSPAPLLAGTTPFILHSLLETASEDECVTRVTVPKELHGSATHDLVLYGLRRHIVAGEHGAIFSPDGLLITESTIGVDPLRAVDGFTHATLRGTVEHISGRLAPAHGFWSDGFWHWMMEWLPRAYIFEELGLAPTYVVPPNRPFITDSLQLLGVPQTRIRAATGASYTADEILTMTPVAGGALDYFPALLLGLRVKLLASVGPPHRRGRRLYLSRGNPHRPRRVVNEPDTEALLRGFDYETVNFDILPLKDQIALVQEASSIVGPHGAGMVHSLFLPPESLVVELMAPTYINPCMLSVCRVLRHRYSIIPSGLWEGTYKYGHDIETFISLLRVTLEREFGNDQFAEIRQRYLPGMKNV
jgi:Glycosyltransferase 61